MDGGVFVEDSPPDQMFTSPKDSRTRQFLQRLLSGEEGRGKK
jgi:ABC-type polar amino acid transport system ATPase subunit